MPYEEGMLIVFDLVSHMAVVSFRDPLQQLMHRRMVR